MTESNIPNGVSFKDLQNAMKDAATEGADTQQGKTFTFHQLCRIAAAAKDKLYLDTHHPLALKMMCLMVLVDMSGWHQSMSLRLREMGDDEAANDWLMDAGQFNLLRNALMDIEVTGMDPTPSWKDMDIPDED